MKGVLFVLTILNVKKGVPMLIKDTPIIIRTAKISEIETVKNFLLQQCKLLYNGEISPNQYQDLEQSQAKYFLPERHTLIGAFLTTGQLVGTIAVSVYNDRISCIKGRYAPHTAAEIGRCYISPELRRSGIGSQLFNAALDFALSANYKFLYLHTHKFLPGGFNFWLKNGFKITVDEEDIHQTVHMELDLAAFIGDKI